MIITFCGHKNIVDCCSVQEKLTNSIILLFSSAQNEHTSLSFYCGGYGEFDDLSEKTVEETRNRFPNVICEKLFITPYITPTYKERNEFMRQKFDNIVYPPLETVPYRYAIIRRNEWMIDQADIVIAHVRYSWGGAARSLEYAKRKKKEILMI